MALPHEVPEDLPLLEQAAGWFDKQLANAMSREEREEFERWRENPDNRLAFAEVEAAYAEARSMASVPEMLALRHEALSRIVLPYARRRRLWTGSAIAASLAAFVAIANWHSVSQVLNRETTQVAGAAAVHPSIYQTAVGEQLTVALPDGSSVSLNTNSRLRLAYNGLERRLILEQGQALFHVAKGQARPFIVEALDRIVTAHGTTFDVRIASDNKVRVALVEGAVTVANMRKGGSPPAELKPRDVLVASGDEVRIAREEEIQREVSWKDGLIIFEDDSLAQATAEVNRYVKTPIVLEDDRLKQIRVSGAFRTGETGAFVEALQISFPVRVVRRTNGMIVLGYRS
jgi:transmembrane sensor